MAGLEPATCSLRVNRTTYCATLALVLIYFIIEYKKNQLKSYNFIKVFILFAYLAIKETIGYPMVSFCNNF